MRNLLTEVSKIKNMMGLTPNINGQSVFDVYNQLSGKSQQNTDSFWDDVNKLTSPGNKSDGVVDTAKKMMTKTITPKNDLTKDDLIVAATIWGEARGEGVEGMKAVANVIKNRADSLKKSPKDIVLQKKQFSIWNDTTTDNFLNKINKSTLKNPKDGSAWENAQNIVKNYVKTKGPDNTKGAQFYHTTSIKPNWDYSKLKYTTTIGNHKFYKPIA